MKLYIRQCQAKIYAFIIDSKDVRSHLNSKFVGRVCHVIIIILHNTNSWLLKTGFLVYLPCYHKISWFVLRDWRNLITHKNASQLVIAIYISISWGEDLLISVQCSKQERKSKLKYLWEKKHNILRSRWDIIGIC